MFLVSSSPSEYEGRVWLTLIAGSYVLFTHMMAQRRKVMRGEKAKKAA